MSRRRQIRRTSPDDESGGAKEGPYSGAVVQVSRVKEAVATPAEGVDDDGVAATRGSGANSSGRGRVRNSGNGAARGGRGGKRRSGAGRGRGWPARQRQQPKAGTVKRRRTVAPPDGAAAARSSRGVSGRGVASRRKESIDALGSPGSAAQEEVPAKRRRNSPARFSPHGGVGHAEWARRNARGGEVSKVGRADAAGDDTSSDSESESEGSSTASGGSSMEVADGGDVPKALASAQLYLALRDAERKHIDERLRRRAEAAAQVAADVAAQVGSDGASALRVIAASASGTLVDRIAADLAVEPSLIPPETAESFDKAWQATRSAAMDATSGARQIQRCLPEGRILPFDLEAEWGDEVIREVQLPDSDGDEGGASRVSKSTKRHQLALQRRAEKEALKADRHAKRQKKRELDEVMRSYKSLARSVDRRPPETRGSEGRGFDGEHAKCSCGSKLGYDEVSGSSRQSGRAGSAAKAGPSTTRKAAQRSAGVAGGRSIPEHAVQHPPLSACCGEECENRMLLQECTPQICSLVEYGLCTNRRFSKKGTRAHAVKKVYIAPVEGKGMGLFAGEDIRAGEFVIEYVGEILDDALTEERLRYYRDNGVQHFHMMELSSSMVIDAGKQGNLARFINHSCEPNCQSQKWYLGNEPRIGIFALKDVKADAELSYDYQFTSFAREKQSCLCGAPGCRGYLGGKDLSKAKRGGARYTGAPNLLTFWQDPTGDGRLNWDSPLFQRFWNARVDLSELHKAGFSKKRMLLVNREAMRAKSREIRSRTRVDGAAASGDESDASSASAVERRLARDRRDRKRMKMGDKNPYAWHKRAWEAANAKADAPAAGGAGAGAGGEEPAGSSGDGQAASDTSASAARGPLGKYQPITCKGRLPTAVTTPGKHGVKFNPGPPSRLLSGRPWTPSSERPRGTCIVGSRNRLYQGERACVLACLRFVEC